MTHRTLLACLLALCACTGERAATSTPGAAAPSPAVGEAPPARRLPASGLVDPRELASYTSLQDPPLLLDVRTDAENETARIAGAIHIPVDELAQRLVELEEGRKRGVILYCQSGRRAKKAMGMLENAGFPDLALLDGSMARWQKEGRPVETGQPAP